MGESSCLSPATSESHSMQGYTMDSGVAQRKDFSGNWLKCEASGDIETLKDAGRETCGPKSDS